MANSGVTLLPVDMEVDKKVADLLFRAIEKARNILRGDIMTERNKKKFVFVYDVTRCAGWQQFSVEAYDLEDAKQKMEIGDCKFDGENIEIRNTIHIDDIPAIYVDDGNRQKKLQ